MSILILMLVLVLCHLPAPLQHSIPDAALNDVCVLLATWICLSAKGPTLASVGQKPGWRSGSPICC